MPFQLDLLFWRKCSRAVRNNQLVAIVLNRTAHNLLPPDAIYASRDLSCSYARNSSDFTADSEQRSTFAISEYSISSYLCISTAARCLDGKHSIACRTSLSLARYTNSCSAVRARSATCLVAPSAVS